jgi:hypothetical protein
MIISFEYYTWLYPWEKNLNMPVFNLQVPCNFFNKSVKKYFRFDSIRVLRTADPRRCKNETNSTWPYETHHETSKPFFAKLSQHLYFATNFQQWNIFYEGQRLLFINQYNKHTGVAHACISFLTHSDYK